jgi:type II secretory pathway predicted ATPase ExeA
LTFLLARFEKELLDLAPETDLLTLEKINRQVRSDSAHGTISTQLTAHFERLQHVIVRRGIALVTGEVGAGKSTALRAYTETLDKNHHTIVYSDDPTLGRRGLLLNSIARQLNLNIKFFTWQLLAELKAAIEKKLRRNPHHIRPPVAVGAWPFRWVEKP